MKLLHRFSLRDLKVAGVSLLLVLVTLMQISVSLNSAMIRRLRRSGPLKESIVDGPLTTFSAHVKTIAKPYFGITNHPVFMDYHFKGYNHIVAVVYKGPNGEEFLPIVKENGQPGEYQLGPVFINWTFRVNNAIADTTQLSQGILRYTAFWAREKHFNLNDLHFEIRVKKIDEYHNWEKDFLRRQLEKPWLPAGVADWKDGKFSAQLMDIEKM
jgi:hypothetical protein